MEAGPVTLGARLLSSRFPGGYEAILYGRGTWLFHMLRTHDERCGAREEGRKGQSSGSADEPFVRALRKVRQRYEGRSISTSELLDVFAEDLPPALRYEGKSSLDWFLEGWINGTSLPRLELKASEVHAERTGGSVVSGTILQKDAPPGSGDVRSGLCGGRGEAVGAAGTSVRRRRGILVSAIGSGRRAQDRA